MKEIDAYYIPIPHVPLAMFLFFNASPNGKAPTIILQMNTFTHNINLEHQPAFDHMKLPGNGLTKTSYHSNPFFHPLIFVNQPVISIIC